MKDPNMRRTEQLTKKRRALAALLAASSLLPVGCGQSQDGVKVVQQTFATPDEAGAALLAVAESADQNRVLSLFGPEARQAIFSGDPVKDKDNFKEFVAAYTQMHRWVELKAGGEMLIIGADNFVFPIPLGKNPSGLWYFDAAAGKDEILARRIGKDELTTIAACEALSSAQNEYFSRARSGDRVKQYAQKLISDDGKQNGLYWPVPAGESPSPLENLRDFAQAVGYKSAGANPQPFFGYYFRILTKQGDRAKGGAKNYITDGKMTGGFAFVAYPADYRNSGIMTFIVGPDGVVYQRDLGEKTTTTAQALTEYDPTDDWTLAL